MKSEALETAQLIKVNLNVPLSLNDTKNIKNSEDCKQFF